MASPGGEATFARRSAGASLFRPLTISGVFATVLEGAIRSEVNDGPVTTYAAGQSFSELAGDRHGISANVSERRPAKLLAVFEVDMNETELTIPFAN
jgi:quercetin dioxygenase-like cupin family protein